MKVCERHEKRKKAESQHDGDLADATTQPFPNLRALLTMKHLRSLCGYRMARHLRCSLFLLLALLGLSAGQQAAADDPDFPGVKALMNADDFSRTGLSKLSERELQALDEWLIRYTAGDARVLQQSNEAVREAEKTYAVESRISGEFTGWSGKTIITLDNGQVWQQRLKGRYQYRGPANPAVRIEKNWAGYYRLTLIDTGRSVGVSRLR